jgi:putative nucleotidyltransferase with HDIG domain
MTTAARFLASFAQALSSMVLYRVGHPARDRAVDAAFELLQRLQEEEEHPVFTFLGDEIVCGSRPVRELKAWDWSTRLAEAGVQRLEFQRGVTRDEFESFLDDVLARITLTTLDTADARQLKDSRIRFGAVGVRSTERAAEVSTGGPSIDLRLDDEAESVRWLHAEVQHHQQLHLVEAEAVVRSLSAAMHSEQRVLLPLLQLRNFDEYTTTHALNVSVLSMAVAEYVGLGAADVRAFGVAGLLHDIGKIRIPLEILTKPGRLTAEEREIINQHTVEGARILIEAEEALDMAAVVAYEHHMLLNGGGYPSPRFPRERHYASRLIHVCDVYDALRTHRPYREAWAADRVLSYIEDGCGTEFDHDVAEAFVRMMREWEPRAADAEITPVQTGPAPPARAG